MIDFPQSREEAIPLLMSPPNSAQEYAPPPTLLEVMGLPEMMWFVLRALFRDGAVVYFLRATKLAAAALRWFPRQRRMLQIDPRSFRRDGGVESLAFQEAEACEVKSILRDVRMRILTRLAPSIDFSQAVRKVMLQDHFHQRAHFAMCVKALIAAGSPLILLYDVPFGYDRHWSVETRARLRAPRWGLRLIHFCAVWLRGLCGNLVLLCKVPGKALLIFTRRRIGLRPGTGQVAQVRPRVLAEVHCLTQTNAYRQVLEPVLATGLTYLFVTPAPEGLLTTLRSRGIEAISVSDLRVDVRYLVARVLIPCVLWLTLTPMILASQSRAYVNRVASALLGSIWRWEAVCNTVACEVFFSQDAYSADSVVRSLIFRTRGVRTINYLHGEFFPSAPNALSQAYHFFDCFCTNGEYYRRQFELLGGTVGRFALTGSHVMDRVFAFCTGATPINSSLVHRVAPYRRLVAFSGGVDGSTISKDWSDRFWRVLHQYVRQHPSTLLLFKLHPIEYEEAAICRFYPGADEDRICMVRDEYEVGELIAVADLVTTTCSTAGIESLAAGKNAVYLNFGADPGLLPYKTYSPRLVIEDEAAVPAMLDRYLSGERVLSPTLQDRIIKEHMTAFDGRAARRVGEAVESLYHSAPSFEFTVR